MNKLDMISNLTGLYKGYSQSGLSRISLKYFSNNLDYLSSTHEMRIRFKRTLSMFLYGYHDIKYIRLKTHSRRKSVDNSIKNTRFFKKRK